MATMNSPPDETNGSKRGKKNYEAGYSFEDRVVDAYRLLGIALSTVDSFRGDK